MGAIRPELSLDFKPTFVPKTISDLLKEVSMIGNVSDKVSKLDGFVKGLEEEMRKIDAFKRELPLCMLLLNDAISALKDESRQCVARNVQPVLEEFIPLKNNRNDHSDKDDGEAISIKKETDSTSTNKDKKTWMSSVQLWNTDESHRSTDRKLERNDEARILGCKSRGEVRAFMPFKAYSGFAGRNEERVDLQNQGLSLLTCGIKNPKEDSNSTGSRNSCSRVSSAPNAQSSFRSGSQPVQQQTARKQRRCWSPELHRRFVNALQHLGGSQVATPKQIRELMQVDGLTNDEVKSHLQKYRLHTRRVPPATSSPANQSLVVLGSSLWMSQEQFGDSLKASTSHSGSPQGPLQLVTNTGGTSTTGGDSMEDEEDAKSENCSWKSHVNRPGKEDV